MEGGENCYRCDKLVGVAREICVYFIDYDTGEVSEFVEAYMRKDGLNLFILTAERMTALMHCGSRSRKRTEPKILYRASTQERMRKRKRVLSIVPKSTVPTSDQLKVRIGILRQILLSR